MKKKELDPKAAMAAELFKGVRSKEDLNGLIGDLMKLGIETILQAEVDEHLGNEKSEASVSGNYRNGTSKKTVKGTIGDIALSIPRDRNGTFEPQIVPKHERMIDNIEDTVIGLYARGMATRDIEDQIRDLYRIDISESTVSTITNRVVDRMKQWQNRPLESVYCVVWMDCIVIKVRDNGKIINKAVYIVIGVNREGIKEVLGMWISPNESASFWVSVLNDIKARGVTDILIACTDNLKGFTQAIKATYPDTDTQLCIVHQIRTSLRFVVWKDKKDFAADLRNIYTAPNEEAALEELNKVKAKWVEKYPHAIQSWERNWSELMTYYKYPKELRKMIYTTNAIESLNSIIRKYTKARVIFPDDTAGLKSIYLSISIIERKWTKQLHNWPLVMNQLLIMFADRLTA